MKQGNNVYRHLCAGLALTFAFGQSALAQDIAADEQSQAVVEVDATAQMGADAPAEGEVQQTRKAPKSLSLDEVVVTAQKRAQDIQEVPISITAISGETFREMNLQSATELTIVMPNATLAVSPTFSTVYVRGIGTGLNDGFEPSVGLYVDGIYLSRQTYLNDSLMDLERVELLRGPQGSLFGKNTVAGALSITNTIPTYEWTGSLDLMYGQGRNRRTNLAFNAPVVDDKLAVRFSGQWQKSNGAIYNQFRDIRELRIDKYSARLKARIDISPDLYVTTALELSNVGDKGQGFEMFKSSPEQEALYQFFDPTHEGNANRVSHLNEDNFANRDTWGGNINVFWTVADHEIAFIGGYNSFEEQTIYDSDASPIPILTWDNDDEYAQWQAELRVISPPGKFEYVGGLFYFGNEYNAFTEFRQFKDNQNDIVGTILTGVLSGGRLLPLQQLSFLNDAILALTPTISNIAAVATEDALFQTFDQTTNTFAAYGQATYRPWEWLEIIAGLRFNYETKDAAIEQVFESTGVFLNAAFGTTEYTVNGSRSETDVTPKLALRYLLNEDINLYATVAKGYKAGGFNPTAPDPSKIEFEEETSWTYEAGIKTSWLDNRLTANLGYFMTEFQDMQISVLSGAGEAFFVDNAASSTVSGVEWEVKGVLWEGNLTSFAGGYLSAYYDEFKRGPCRADEEGDANGFCDRTGERMVRAPKWDITFSINQAFPLGNWPIGMYVGTDWVMQTKHFTDQDNDINTQQKTYTVQNVRLGIGDIDQTWSLSVNGHNIWHEDIKGGVTDTPLFAGSYFGILAPRGFWTVEARFNW